MRNAQEHSPLTIDDFHRGRQDHELEACTKGVLPLGKVHRLEAHNTTPMVQATGRMPAVQLEAHGTSYRQDARSTQLEAHGTSYRQDACSTSWKPAVQLEASGHGQF